MQLEYEGVIYEGISEVSSEPGQTIAIVLIDYEDVDDRAEGSAYVYRYNVDNATTSIDTLRRYMGVQESDRVITSIHIYEKVMVL